MLFSIAEIEALRLAAWCKDLPVNCTETIKAEIMDTLCFFGFLRQSRNGISYRPTPAAYNLLSKAGILCEQDQTYRGKSDMLYRRLHIAEIILFLYKVYGDIFWKGSDWEIFFIPSFTFRRKNAANLLGGTRLAGFLYTTNITYVPYYLSDGNDGIYPLVEERTITSSQLHRKKEIRIIYTGKNDLSKLIETAAGPENKKQKSTTISFLNSIEIFTCPVCFVPLSEDGARQLRIMCRPAYENILARHLLGNEYTPSPEGSYHALHKTTGEPFIIGIDCNLKSFSRAASAGDRPLHIILFKYQLPAVQNYLAGKNTILHSIDMEDAEAILKMPRSFHVPDDSPCRIPGGGYIHAPSFKNDRKSGEKNRSHL